MKKTFVILLLLTTMVISFVSGIIVGVNSVITEEYIIVPGTVIDQKERKGKYI